MNEERRTRYRLAKPIAMAALELAEVEREGYIATRCDGNETLCDEVRWMLEAAEATAEYAGLPPLAVSSDVVGSTLNAADSSGYRILRRLGEGGGGVVYLAERSLGEGSPDEFRQQVAIKFLHAGAVAGNEALRRFAEERRILAALNHPNIAHLVDGGTTRDGHPFLALEYVQGERIDHWCERNALSLRERVALFLKVCGAVHHAHQHLVIHRDLKPGNILVNADGEPKLLDFGIARLLGQVDADAATRTSTGMRNLTLAYASPEQLRGQALGTAADVWSLGVVLYQLMCGVRPFGDEESSPVSLSQAIDTGKLLPPSRRLRKAGVAASRRRTVPADIDAIVMKALRRDPCERYAGVDAMSADLHRFLAARPVRARHGAAWYHLRLYLRRHALGVGVAALVLGMLLAFAVQRMQQMQRLELERDKTAAIAGFLQNLFENADPTHARGSKVTVREVLDRGAATLAARQDIAAPVRASLLLSMGRAYNQLGLGARAIPLLEDARGLQAGYAATALERARVLAALGRAYSTVINLPAAIPLDREALTLLEKAPGDHAVEMLRVRINLLYNQLSGSAEQAAAVEREVRQVLASMAARAPAEPELQLQAEAVLAMAQAARGDDAEAIVNARQALVGAERLYVTEDPARVYYRFVLALVSMRSDPAGAIQLFRRAIEDYDRLVGGANTSMAGMLTFFGASLRQVGDLPDARDALLRAATLTRQVAQVSPDFRLYTLTELARVEQALGQNAAAARLLQPLLLQLQQRAQGGQPWAQDNHTAALLVLGDIALADGAGEFAAQHFQAARRQMGERGPRELPEEWARALAGLGEAALLQGERGQAERWLAQLRAFNRQGKPAPDRPRMRAARVLADHLQARHAAPQVAAVHHRPACEPNAALPRVATVAPPPQSCQHAPLTMAAGAGTGMGAKR